MADEQRTVGTQSYSGASGPSKPVTAYDGDTPTKYDASTDPVLKSINPPEATLGSFGNEKPHYPPCINPSCRSYGKSHPNCRCYAGPGGTSLENATFAEGGEVHHCSKNNMHKPECEFYEHPQETVDQAVVHHGLAHLLTKTGYSKSEDPNRAMLDHKDASMRGRKTHDDHVKNVFEKGQVNKKSTDALRNRIEEFTLQPELMLSVGGNLDPEHAVHVAALASTATDYLNSIKPKEIKANPHEKPIPNDKMEEASYQRALDLAEHPLSVLNHVKEGTLVPSDVVEISTLYPHLYAGMKEQAFEAVLTAESNDKEIPYKQRQSLSLLLGQPLDFTQTPDAMRAIIASAGPQQMQQQSKNQPKKATSVELKQINKVDDLYDTPLDNRLAKQTKSK